MQSENTHNESDKHQKVEPKKEEQKNPMLLVKTTPMPTKMEFAEKKDDKKKTNDD